MIAVLKDLLCIEFVFGYFIPFCGLVLLFILVCVTPFGKDDG
jgi:hypothetical protein